MAEVNVDNIANHMRNIYISRFDINSVQKVYVTHINNPHDFYVMLSTYKRHINLLELAGPQIEKQNIHRGANVVFQSKTEKKLVRGEIYNMNKDNDTCYIRSIDYGFVEAAVPFSDIFKPSQDFIPPLAVNCQVIECFPIGGGTWDPDAITFMKNYVGEGLAEVVIKGQIGDKYQVELKNFTNPGLGMEMCLIGLTQMRCSANTVSKLSFPKPQKGYFKFKELKVGDYVHVRAVTGKTLEAFYVAEVEDYRAQMEERGAFLDWGKQCKPLQAENIREGAAVIVYDGYYRSYERAIIKQVCAENKVLVQYIDNGTEKTVHVSIVKELSEKFLRHTAIAIYCAAQNCQKLDYRLLKYLYPGFEFKIKILELGDKFDRPHIVEMSSL